MNIEFLHYALLFAEDPGEWERAVYALQEEGYDWWIYDGIEVIYDMGAIRP